MNRRYVAAAGLLIAGIANGPARADVILETFGTNVVCNTTALFAGGCSWYGAQHGVSGPSSTMAWNGGAGADGAPGFVGYSPTTRAGVTLVTDSISVRFADLHKVEVDTRHASNPANPAGLNHLALFSGGQWYVSATGFVGNGTTWQHLTFDLSTLQFAPYSTDGILPNVATGPATVLPSDLQITQMGVFVVWSGQNNPNSGFVLRFDNFAVTVPEPATLAVLGFGLMGLAAARWRRHV